MAECIFFCAFHLGAVFGNRGDSTDPIIRIGIGHTVGGDGIDLRCGTVITVTPLIPVYTLLFVLSSETGRARVFSSLAPFGELLFSDLQGGQSIVESFGT